MYIKYGINYINYTTVYWYYNNNLIYISNTGFVGELYYTNRIPPSLVILYYMLYYIGIYLGRAILYYCTLETRASLFS